MAPDDEPYLELAREIRAEVERAAEEGRDMDAAFDLATGRERAQVARAAFDRLPADERWAVLARLFDDDLLRAALAEAHATSRADVARTAADRDVARTARAAGRIDLDPLPDGTTLALGLFRAEDVGAALRRGGTSSVCARRLLVRALPGPEVQVLADVFNPERGLFVTPDYDERVWATERLEGHARVRLGSLGPEGFEPVLYPGGRVDVDGRPGRLHLGFVVIGDEDVYAASS